MRVTKFMVWILTFLINKRIRIDSVQAADLWKAAISYDNYYRSNQIVKK